MDCATEWVPPGCHRVGPSLEAGCPFLGNEEPRNLPGGAAVVWLRAALLQGAARSSELSNFRTAEGWCYSLKSIRRSTRAGAADARPCCSRKILSHKGLNQQTLSVKSTNYYKCFRVYGPCSLCPKLSNSTIAEKQPQMKCK